MSLKRNKYGAKKCELDGIKFDSMAERDRYLELKILACAGEISDLTLKPRYRLDAWRDGEPAPVGWYTPDFRYFEHSTVTTIVEDVKGAIQQHMRQKMKHFEAQYGIPVTIINMQKRRRAA